MKSQTFVLVTGNQLPPEVHATLTRERIGKGRVIVIGDIHGCDMELSDLLAMYCTMLLNYGI